MSETGIASGVRRIEALTGMGALRHVREQEQTLYGFRTDDERDSARLQREVERARADAREGADMLADLSHEMRTPLNAVIGFAETIERETFGPIGHENYAQYAEHIRASGRHLLDLV